MQQSYEAEVVSFAQELVRQPGLSGQEGPAAALIEREMQMLGYDEITRDELGSVIGVIRGAQPGWRVLFDGHMDVVPITSPEAWRHPPAGGVYADGRIWGRGAADMKGPLAAAIVALGSLRRADLAGTLILSASVGEEMIEGVALRHVLARHPADRIVIGEPTGLRLGVGHKGRAGLVLEAQGVAAHSSRPELGVNAIYRLIDAVARIRQAARAWDEALGPGVNELVEIISAPYPGTSMVPHGCTARFDRRLVRGETAQTVLDDMQLALDGASGVTVRYHRAELTCYTGHQVAVDDVHPAWALPQDHPLVRRAREGLAQADERPDLYLAPYCTNGSTSAGELGLPTIIYGPGEVDQAHAVDESIAVADLARAFRGYRALARALTLG